MTAARHSRPRSRYASNLRVWWPVWAVGLAYLTLAIVLGSEVISA